MKHQVPPMMIVEHKKYYIINQINIRNINSILTIEQHRNLLPEMCMIGKWWIIKVEIIVVYHTST